MWKLKPRNELVPEDREDFQSWIDCGKITDGYLWVIKYLSSLPSTGRHLTTGAGVTFVTAKSVRINPVTSTRALYDGRVICSWICFTRYIPVKTPSEQYNYTAEMLCKMARLTRFLKENNNNSARRRPDNKLPPPPGGGGGGIIGGLQIC